MTIKNRFDIHCKYNVETIENLTVHILFYFQKLLIRVNYTSFSFDLISIPNILFCITRFKLFCFIYFISHKIK